MKLFNSTTVKRLAAFSLAVGSIGFVSTKANADEFVVQSDVAYQPRPMQDLEQLTAPIALYPDALLAQVLVASTYPNDVVDAALYLQNGGDPYQIDGFSWDASVKGLVQTPDVLNQLAGDTPWMNQLGDAFLNQQPDVFAAVQALRVQAQNAGNLFSNDQQQVVTADNCVQIIPTDPQVIYVPQYDPQIVYVVRERPAFYEPCVTFTTGIQVGLWLHDDFDWHEHHVYVGDWGYDRPWWHHNHDRGGDQIDYVQNRPGVYVNNVTNVTNVKNVTNIRNNTNVNVRNTTTEWTRNVTKPAPQHENGAIVQHVAKPMPTIPTNTVTPPAVGPNRNVNVTNHTTLPVKPAVGPNRNVNVPAHTMTQPIQPNRNVNVATHAMQPNPNVNIATPTPAPVKPAIQPNRNVNVPTHTVMQPVKPAIQPTRPVNLPTRSVQPSKPIAQPTKPVSFPTHSLQPKPVAQPARATAQPSSPAGVATHVQTSNPASHALNVQPTVARTEKHPAQR